MDTLAVNEFRRQVGEYLNQTYYAGKAFTLVKGNRPMAALIPIAMLERLNKLEKEANSVTDTPEAIDATLSTAKDERVD